MRLITELNENVTVIEEGEGSKKSMFIEGIFLQQNIKNRNGRIYPPAVMEGEVNRYIREYVEDKRAWGELGHPDKPTINPDRISHRIVNLRREGHNWIGKAQISSTPMGDIVRGLINDGGKLAVSSRGVGSLKTSEGVDVVQDDFKLATAADIVTDPSAPDAFVRGIYEGKEWVWDNGILQEREIQEIKKEVDKHLIVPEEVKEVAFLKFIQRLSGINEAENHYTLKKSSNDEDAFDVHHKGEHKGSIYPHVTPGSWKSLDKRGFSTVHRSRDAAAHHLINK